MRESLTSEELAHYRAWQYQRNQEMVQFVRQLFKD